MSTKVLGRFTGNAPCPLWPSCLAEDGQSDKGCSGDGGEARLESEVAGGSCLVQREWSWLALQVHRR